MQLYEAVRAEEALHQGDVFKGVFFPVLNAEYSALLVSAECDIVNDKVDFYILAAVTPLHAVLESINPKDYRDLLAKKANKINNDIFSIVKQKQERWHWLGSLPEHVGDFVVDFQCLLCLNPDSELGLSGKRVCRITTPYLQSITHFLASYISRVALPIENSDKDKIAKDAFNVITS